MNIDASIECSGQTVLHHIRDHNRVVSDVRQLIAYGHRLDSIRISHVDTNGDRQSCSGAEWLETIDTQQHLTPDSPVQETQT